MHCSFTYEICSHRLGTLEDAFSYHVRHGNKFTKHENLSSILSSLKSFNRSLRDSLDLTRGERQRLMFRSRFLSNKLNSAITALITL